MSIEQEHDLDPWLVEQPAALVRVWHLFWSADLAFAKAHGLDCRALCGVWEDSKPDAEMDGVALVGGLMPDVDPDDCATCAEIYGLKAWVDSED